MIPPSMRMRPVYLRINSKKPAMTATGIMALRMALTLFRSMLHTRIAPAISPS